MPNWEDIRQEWETTKITFKDLAVKHNVKLGTLKSRRSREKWNRDATNKKDATSRKRMQPKKERYPNGHPGNKNPENQFTKRNQASRKHGLYAKYFTDTQKEIIEDFEDFSLIDKLWIQIEIKFSAIIQLQKVMWVENSYDVLTEVSGESSSFEGDSTSYKVIYAHEQYESYIKAQSRAMAEYRNLVKQYLEITDEFDERRLKLEAMQAQIDKNKAETKNEETETTKTIVLTNEEEMRKVIEERKAAKENE